MRRFDPDDPPWDDDDAMWDAFHADDPRSPAFVDADEPRVDTDWDVFHNEEVRRGR